MGIQDRDYMRERNRKTFDHLVGDRDPPFTPGGKSPSTIGMILFWLAAGYVLYQAYGWWFHKQEASQAARARAVGAAQQERRAQANLQQAPARSGTGAATPPPRIAVLAEPARQAAPVPAAAARVEPPARQEAPLETSGTIYLCRAYNGGTFWAQAHCAKHRALIETIASVPPALPFQQQVHIAEQQRREARTEMVHGAPAPGAAPDPAIALKTQCEALDARVLHLDALARQPQSGQMQDWIRGQRQQARDRQFGLHC